jgi:VIT1/CCC1 family predicted Fe2+/Mn2+ transporter
VPITSDEQRIDLYRDIVANLKTDALERASLHRVDFAAAAVVFVSVVSPCVPAALPFLLISDPVVALRASNALLIGMLYWVGYRWAGYTDLDPRIAGLMSAVVGMALVFVAIALGG